MATKERRNRDIRRRYKITITQIEAILKEQNHECAICHKGIDDRACMDHCHETGKLRALLCNTCNSGLGMFKDDEELISSALRYLMYWRARFDCED